VWPTCETLHFLGMSLMSGVLLIGPPQPASHRSRGMFVLPRVHRLAAFAPGLRHQLHHGMFFFVAASEQYTQNVAFHYRFVLLILAGVNFLVLTVYDDA